MNTVFYRIERMSQHMMFPGFQQCLRLMATHNPQTQEDGFYQLLPYASEYVSELIEAFQCETEPGLKCWLLELIGEAKSPDAFHIFIEQLDSEDESLKNWAIKGLKKLNTKAARKTLYEKRIHA